jgi:hypothetical protein
MEAFATQIARLLPNVCQSLHDHNAIWRVTSARSTGRFEWAVFEQVNSVLSMVSCCQDELVQDLSSF